MCHTTYGISCSLIIKDISINEQVFQDNKGAMRMEINVRNSCTGNIRHINIRYIFIKDRVDKGDLSIMYCPTHFMLEDGFFKLLKWSLFHDFRDIFTGRVIPHTVLKENTSYSSKDRVENFSGEKSIKEYIPLKDPKFIDDEKVTNYVPTLT